MNAWPHRRAKRRVAILVKALVMFYLQKTIDEKHFHGKLVLDL